MDALVTDGVEVAADRIGLDVTGQQPDPLLGHRNQLLAARAVHHGNRGLDNDHGMPAIAADEVAILDGNVITHGSGQRPHFFQQQQLDSQGVGAGKGRGKNAFGSQRLQVDTAQLPGDRFRGDLGINDRQILLPQHLGRIMQDRKLLHHIGNGKT